MTWSSTVVQLENLLFYHFISLVLTIPGKVELMNVYISTLFTLLPIVRSNEKYYSLALAWDVENSLEFLCKNVNFSF